MRDDLLRLGSATVGEAGASPMHPRIKAAWAGAAIAAPAFTVTCTTADNLAVHAAVASAPEGSVLVVAVEPPERGYWGEVLTTAAEARGIVGLVIDGGVRDLAALEAHRFPVFSVLIALRGADKCGPGTIGRSAVVGDVAVRTGDWVIADRDGVAVVPWDRLDEVVERATARADKEAAMFADLRAGATTIDLLGLDVSSVDG